jgi:ribonuclease E
MGRISGFGLMEISRQRRRLGVIEGATEVCPHCAGAGRVRSAESAALMVLRAVDIEAGKNGAGSVNLKVSSAVALYILNHKRDYLQHLQRTRGLAVVIQIDDRLGQGESSIERTETNEDFTPPETTVSLADLEDDFDDSAFHDDEDFEDDDDIVLDDEDESDLDREDADDDEPRERSERQDGERGRGRGRRRRGGRRDEAPVEEAAPTNDDDDADGRRRRRGRRGGRRMREDGEAEVGSSFFWVRGRTPSLEDPYVWFDPLNPQPRGESAPVQASENGESERPARTPESLDAGVSGDREGGRRRRRRGRGRGRDRFEQEDAGPAETPDAVTADAEESAAVDPAPEGIVEPQRRRVRRKSVSATALAEADAEVAEAPAAKEPVSETVTEPEVVVEAAPEPIAEPAPEPEPNAAPAEPEPEAAAPSLTEIIANDPAQITAPPPKPKRGWWRL